MNQANFNDDGAIDDAARALLESPVPDGPDPKLVERTIAKLQAQPIMRRGDIEISEPFSRRFAHLSLGTKLTAIAAGILLLVGIAGWLLTYNGSSAYAQIRRELEEARTIRFRASLGDQTRSFMVMLKEPGLMRIESPDGPITIVNFRQGKIMTLVPKSKTALTADLGTATGNITPRNFLAEMKEVISSSAKDLGVKEDYGTKIKGYRLSKGGKTYDLWVDAHTAAPVQIEVNLGPGAVLICRDVSLNQPLDDSLFSLVPPPGYELRPGEAPPPLIGNRPNGGSQKGAPRTLARGEDDPAPFQPPRRRLPAAPLS